MIPSAQDALTLVASLLGTTSFDMAPEQLSVGHIVFSMVCTVWSMKFG